MSSEITNVSTLASVAAVRIDRRVQGENNLQDTNTVVRATVSDSDESGPAGIKKANTAQSLKTVKNVTDTANPYLQAVNRNLEFKVDSSTQEVVVKVVDSANGKVVRQIPSEEILTFIKRLQELDGQNGSILQDRA